MYRSFKLVRMSEFNTYLHRGVYLFYICLVSTSYITNINFDYVRHWNSLLFYSVIAILTVVLAMTQDAGHIFHLFPVTPPSNALRSERDCACANMLWWAFSCITCHLLLVTLLQWNRCICVALLYPGYALWWKHTSMSKVSSPSGQRPSVPDCGNVLTTGLKFCIVFCHIPWERLSVCFVW